MRKKKISFVKVRITKKKLKLSIINVRKTKFIKFRKMEGEVFRNNVEVETLREYDSKYKEFEEECKAIIISKLERK